ncbi:MAG: hypothetical protein ACUZ8N_10490 [Candidatus Scalindua sp.]
MIDYTIFYKSTLPIDTEWTEDNSWDIFISAYNSSERVQKVFDKAKAKAKHWLILPDYEYDKKDYPSGKVFCPPHKHESEFVQEYIKESKVKDFANLKVCIDITGFIKPYMMYLLKWFMEHGLNKFDVIFSEPADYAKKEDTQFSDEVVSEVRQVAGFEGTLVTDVSNDVLILGAGYDDVLITEVAESKKNSKIIQLFGLPSLRPAMYQENVLRANRAANAVGVGIDSQHNNYFAPANDPFVTASVLSEIVKMNSSKHITNLYICPLATKAQALGFIIYYLTECRDKAVNMIYPICASHSKETSKGVSRIWKYVVELPKDKIQ